MFANFAHSEDVAIPQLSYPRVALITGGSRGIGAACIRRFVQAGWKIATVSYPGETSACWPDSSVLHVRGDLASEQVCETVVNQTLERYGRVDVLVNNAGVGLYAPPSTVDLPLLRRMLEVNFFAALRLSQLVIPSMRRERSGAIVNIGSVAGDVALPWAAGYCASKHALHSITDSLRRELSRDHIRVIKICPGIVATNFRDNVLSGTAPPSVLRLRRVITPEVVAEAVLRGAESRRSRTIYVPQLGRLFSATQHVFPWLMDWYLERHSAPAHPMPNSPATRPEFGD